MLQTYEALLEPDGHLRFMEPMPDVPRQTQRVLVTLLKPETDEDSALCGAALSELSLARDWSRPEEDAAWAHLQESHPNASM